MKKKKDEIIPELDMDMVVMKFNGTGARVGERILQGTHIFEMRETGWEYIGERAN